MPILNEGSSIRGPQRLPSHLRNFCIYTGRTLLQSQLSKEHVIPKSLGGNKSTVIWVDQKTNNDFGSSIDGKIEKDPMVSFGRRDTDSRGHSNKIKTPELRNAVQWRPEMPLRSGVGSFTLRFPKAGAVAVNNRTREAQIAGSLGEPAFVIWDLPIDHTARLKFTLKTLLGLGWKLFQEDFIHSIDVEFVRRILTSPIQIVEGTTEGGLSFTDGFLEKTELGRARYERLAEALVRKSKTTIMVRQKNGKLNWSIACLGYFVGSVWLPLERDLFSGELRKGNGLLLSFGREAYEVEMVPQDRLDV
jgi:hypothetical protein